MNPLAPVHKLVDRTVTRSLAQQKLMVTAGAHGYGRAMRWSTVIRGICFIAIVLVCALDLFEGIVQGFVIAIPAATWAMMPHKQALAYRNGWMDGRQNALQEMSNHSAPQDWVGTLMYHDFVHVLGAEPVIPDDIEGMGFGDERP